MLAPFPHLPYPSFIGHRYQISSTPPLLPTYTLAVVLDMLSPCPHLPCPLFIGHLPCRFRTSCPSLPLFSCSSFRCRTFSFLERSLVCAMSLPPSLRLRSVFSWRYVAQCSNAHIPLFYQYYVSFCTKRSPPEARMTKSLCTTRCILLPIISKSSIVCNKHGVMIKGGKVMVDNPAKLKFTNNEMQLRVITMSGFP